jgi:hypothetical protein
VAWARVSDLSSRRRALIVCAVAAVALVVVASIVYQRLRAPEWSSDGPVRLPNEHGYVVRYQVGDVFTDGLERIKLDGGQSAVLRRVEITGPSADHFSIVGVMVAGPHRRLGSWEFSDGYPPHKPGLGELVPAKNAPLATAIVGSVLLIGLKVVKPGLGIRTGVRVFYTVGDRKYTALLPASIANCPDGMSTNRCQEAYLEAAG